MSAKLFNYLQFEKQILQELVRLSERQQKALVKYNISELEEVSSYQEELAKSLRRAEEQRIDFIMNWLAVSRNEAQGIGMSQLEKRFKNEELKELKDLRKALKQLLTNLQTLNSTNRMLANRARSSISEMMGVMTNGRNHVYNVRV